jgi:hypothetical protein
MTCAVIGRRRDGACGERRAGPGAWFLDPLGLFLRPAPATLDNATLRDLPDDKKTAAVAVITDRGRTVPKDARIVWPVVCKESR